MKVRKFQSLLGFLMRCDIDDGVRITDINKFQSLLGFLMRCDASGTDRSSPP